MSLTRDHVEGILSRYKGSAAALRLNFLASQCGGDVQRAALQGALDKLSQGVVVGASPVFNTALHKRVHDSLSSTFADAPKLDAALLGATEAKMLARQAELEREVQQATSCAIRDSMRVSGGKGAAL